MWLSSQMFFSIMNTFSRAATKASLLAKTKSRLEVPDDRYFLLVFYESNNYALIIRASTENNILSVLWMRCAAGIEIYQARFLTQGIDEVQWVSKI